MLALMLSAIGVVLTYKNYEKFKVFSRHEIEIELRGEEKTVEERLAARHFALELLSFNPYILDSLSEENSPDVQAKIRRYLDKIRKKSGFLAIFLLDAQGNCVLSTDVRFEGKNYGFRPYFKQAIAKGEGSYVALGVTSKKLGLYLSKRVTGFFGNNGVLVAKLDPNSLLEALTVKDNPGFTVWGATDQGVLFNPRKSGFYLFEKENEQQYERLRKTRQFEGVTFKSLGFPRATWSKLKEKGKITVRNRSSSYDVEYFSIIPGVFSIATVISGDFLPPSLEILRRAFWVTNCAFVFSLILLVAGLFFLKRQYNELAQERKERSRSQYRYQAILRGSKDGFVVLDNEDLRIVEANERFYEILNEDIEKATLLGKSFQDLMADKDSRRFMKMLPGDSSTNFEFHANLVDSQGELIPVIIDFTIHETEDRDTSFCYAFIQDMRKGLRDARKIRLLETAVEQSGSSIVITDNEGKIQYANPAFTQITGYSSEEVLGRNHEVFKSNYHDEAFYRDLWDTISSGKVWHGRFCNRKKDGSLFWEDTTIAPVQDEKGKISHYIAIKNDVTKLVALEEELNQKVKELEGIMEHAGVGIALIRNRRFLSVNSTLAKIVNMTKEDMIGTSTRILFSSDEEYESFGKIFYPALLRGESVFYEIKRIMPNGQKRWFQITATAINPGTMEDMMTVWVGNDITELKRLQIDLERQKERAEEASRAKSAFLANMSHEIRTPLNGVIGMLSLLGGTRLDAQQKEYVKVAHSSAEALLYLLNDILDFSKIEAGRLEFDSTDFCLSQLLDDFAKSFALAAKRKGLGFRLSLSKEVPGCLKGDPGRLRQVFLNLTGNALKFTQQGWIELAVDLVNEEAHHVVLKFSVIDTGIGIPNEKKSLLFEKFSQVDASISRKFGGTGLGLAISKKLVEMMDGQIGVESEEGKGSTFWFTVRLAKGDPNSQGCKDKTENESQYESDQLRLTGRILVVEDNPVNQQVVVGLLRRLGLRAEVVNNGKEALEVLEMIPYDMVLMDIQMPVMDGLSAAKAIRDPNSSVVINREIPIVALTAHAFKEEIDRCIEAGMDDYLAKPIETQRLIDVLRKWLPKSNIEDATESEKVKGTSSVHVPSQTDQDGLVFDSEGFWERTMNDTELGRQVLEMFMKSGQELLEQLESVLDKGDVDQVVRIAHSLKGSSGNVGAKRLAEFALDMEKSAKTDALDELKDRLSSIKKEFERFRQNQEVQSILK